MSTYLGNLSEHTCRDELEHVFRRFGHCYLQPKSKGYGFVVFDLPLDAGKALRALKSKNICGEPLTLTRSNKQPTHFQRFGWGGRAYELQHARNSERLGYARRKVNLSGWKNYRMCNIGMGESVHMPHEERGYHQNDFQDYVVEEKAYVGDLSDDGGGVIPNLEDNGQWDEPIHDPSIDKGNQNAIEFDQYEPHNGYERKHENGNNHLGQSGGPEAKQTPKRMRGEDTLGRKILTILVTPNTSKLLIDVVIQDTKCEIVLKNGLHRENITGLM